MEIKHLNTFVEIMNTGSFTGAAKKLGYAQSTITAHIHLLEQDLSVKLFERTAKINQPTREALAFLPYAKQMLAMKNEAQNVMMSISGQMVGEVVLGVTQAVSTKAFLNTLTSFSSDFPGVELTIKNIDCPEIPHKLKQNEIDMAFATGQPIRDATIKAYAARNESMVLAFPAGRFSRETLDVETILSERFIVNWKGCSFRNLLERCFDHWGGVPRLMEIGSIQAMKELCACGLGMIYLPSYVLREELEKGILDGIAIEEMQKVPVVTQLSLHQNKTLTPAMKVLCEGIADILAG